jgi:hypothetical protein
LISQRHDLYFWCNAGVKKNEQQHILLGWLAFASTRRPGQQDYLDEQLRRLVRLGSATTPALKFPAAGCSAPANSTMTPSITGQPALPGMGRHARTLVF